MEYRVDHISKGKIRPGKKLNLQYITIHSTGNPTSTALNERGWLTNPTNTRIASWHIAVDEKMAVEAIPLDEIAYHAGNREGNNKSIGVEICESGDRVKTLKNAAELTAKLLHEKNWGIDRLKRHYDWSGKNCPRILNYNNWEGWTKFKADVAKELEQLKGGNIMPNTPSAWAKDAWEWARKGKYLDGSRPRDPVTREELAIVIKKVVDRIEK